MYATEYIHTNQMRNKLSASQLGRFVAKYIDSKKKKKNPCLIQNSDHRFHALAKCFSLCMASVRWFKACMDMDPQNKKKK